MYSNVVYASAWKATNGFSESMLEELPSRKTPPCFTDPAWPLPQPVATRAPTAATATIPETRRNLWEEPDCLAERNLTLRHLRSRATAAHERAGTSASCGFRRHCWRRGGPADRASHREPQCSRGGRDARPRSDYVRT